MKRWTLIDQVLLPQGSRMSFCEHDGSYAIRVDGVELMSTRRHASEEQIAVVACGQLAHKRAVRVLVGGLGFGYTLKSVLAVVPSDAIVVVAEIVEAVVRWNSNPAYPLAAKALQDPRVSLVNRDVYEVISKDQQGFDAIIMDVDNGPRALCDSGNKRIYQEVGLEIAKSRLRPGGCLAFWSAQAAPPFFKAMQKVGLDVTVQKAAAAPNGGGMHTLYFGRQRSRALHSGRPATRRKA